MSLQSFSPVPPGSPNLVSFVGQVPKKFDGRKDYGVDTCNGVQDSVRVGQ